MGMMEPEPKRPGVEGCASVWSSVTRSCSPDLEEHGWRTNFSHSWPPAGPLEPQAAESAPSSL